MMAKGILVFISLLFFTSFANNANRRLDNTPCKIDSLEYYKLDAHISLDLTKLRSDTFTARIERRIEILKPK